MDFFRRIQNLAEMLSAWNVTTQACSFSHHFHNYPLFPLSIEFSIKDPLPGAEIKTPCCDGHNDLVMDQQCFQVRVGIVLAGFVMFVVLSEGGQMLEPLINVFDQSGLVVVDVNASGNVHG